MEYEFLVNKTNLAHNLFLVHLQEGVLISPQPYQEGNKLQRTNSGFIQHTPHQAQYTTQPVALTFASHSKNSENCPSNQVSAAAMTSASDEKWRPFSCFFFQSREQVFINLYVFRTAMSPSSRETTVFMRHSVLVILCG